MQDVIEYGSQAVTRRAEFSAELLNEFLRYLDAGSKKTEETYCRALRQFFTWCGLNGIRTPEKLDLIAFKDELKATGHKATTIQSYVNALRAFFSWTASANLYPNIAERLKGEKLSREPKKDYLTTSQLKAVLSTADRGSLQGLRDYAVLSLMVSCGLRTIEVIRANIEDLRTLGNNVILYVQGKGKTEKADYVKVPAPVESSIREYLKARGPVKEGAPLFASLSNNSKGGRLSTRSVSGIAKEHMRGAGYDSTRLTAHSLRHSAVTLALLAGKDITEVQQFARHANIATTMIYAHALEKSKNSCSEAIANAIF